MFNVEIKMRKEYMSFADNKSGNTVEMQGIRVILGPKVEKFFIMENITQGTKSNLELLGYTNPNIVQWYMNSSVGSEIILREVEPDHADLSDLGYSPEPNSRKIEVL